MDNLLAVSGNLEVSLSDLERAALVLIDAEQRKISPDNALIATLCNTVRLCRQLAAKDEEIKRLREAIKECEEKGCIPVKFDE